MLNIEINYKIHPKVIAHSKKYDFFGGSQLSVSAGLFNDAFVPIDYDNRSIQELIVLEVFLQKVINVYL